MSTLQFNLELPAEVDEYYAIKEKCLKAGWQPGTVSPLLKKSWIGVIFNLSKSYRQLFCDPLPTLGTGGQGRRAKWAPPRHGTSTHETSDWRHSASHAHTKGIGWHEQAVFPVHVFRLAVACLSSCGSHGVG